MLTANAAGVVTEIRSGLGTIVFNGAGGYTAEGRQNTGLAGAMAFTASGTYSVSTSGLMTMTNPLDTTVILNARLGLGAVVGSSTDSGTGIHDLFVAIQAPLGPVNFGVPFTASTIEFPDGTGNRIRSATFRLTPRPTGGFEAITVRGRAADMGALSTMQTVTGATFRPLNLGASIATFPLPSGTSASTQLLSGVKNIYLSADGNILIGGSTEAGVHDFLIATKNPSTGAGNQLVEGTYFAGGLRLDNESRPSSFTGAASSNGAGRIVWSRRMRDSGRVIDQTAASAYRVLSDGAGTLDQNSLTPALGLRYFVAASPVRTDMTFELLVAIRAIPASAPVPFLSPQGVANAASFAPAGTPIAPGEFISLFGAGLAASTAVAARFPFPQTLGGVQVLINGAACPIYFVSPGQISAIVPASIPPGPATVVVRTGGTATNIVAIRVARTSPGVFTVPPAGVGPGAVLRQDFSLVSATAPIRRGEAIQIFLTGLGELQPPVPDGEAASTTVLSHVTTAVSVYIGGARAKVLFAGAAPGLAGLYQVNVLVPPDAPEGPAVSLSIETPDALTELASIAVVQ